MTAVPPVSGPPAPSDRGMRWTYWAIGGLLVILCVIGIITYNTSRESERAEQLAAELTQKLEAAGLTPPDMDVIVRSLGDDGGAVCDNPADALGRAILLDLMTNGASFVGRRPVIVDRDVIAGEALILETYCPDELPEFRDAFDDLKFDDTIEQ
jgi:hypothetical protein